MPFHVISILLAMANRRTYLHVDMYEVSQQSAAALQVFKAMPVRVKSDGDTKDFIGASAPAGIVTCSPGSLVHGKSFRLKLHILEPSSEK